MYKYKNKRWFNDFSKNKSVGTRLAPIRIAFVTVLNARVFERPAITRDLISIYIARVYGFCFFVFGFEPTTPQHHPSSLWCVRASNYTRN